MNICVYKKDESKKVKILGATLLSYDEILEIEERVNNWFERVIRPEIG